MVALKTHINAQQHHSLKRNYLLGQKILASSVYSCTFKVRLIQILRLSFCYIVNQENDNFGLHHFLEAPFLSEEKTLSLYTVIANLCQSIYKCPHTLQKMRLRIQSHRHFRNKIVEGNDGKSC